MTPVTFVDSGGWYSLVVQDDLNHRLAKTFVADNRTRLITTDYILDEALTLLRSRVGFSHAIRFLDMLHASQVIQLVYLTPEHITAAVRLFRERPDKEWSFTDCTSFVLMEKLGIQEAFAFDKHFRQAGFRVVP